MLCLQRGLTAQSSQAKVGTEHSRQKKQTASQYLLSLPNTQSVVNNGKTCRAARPRKAPWLPGACVLVRRQRRGRLSVRGWGNYWLWHCLPSSILCLRPSWTTALTLPVPRASQFFPVGGEHSHLPLLFPVPTALYLDSSQQ